MDPLDKAKRKSASLQARPDEGKRLAIPRSPDGRPPMTPQARAELERLQQQQQAQQPPPRADAPADTVSEGGPMGPPPAEDESKPEIFDGDKPEEDRPEPTESDIISLQRAIISSSVRYATEERRKAVEARCPDMIIDDLLETGEVRQKVPIIHKGGKDKLVVEYRSVRYDEHLLLLSVLGDVDPNDLYLSEKASVQQLAAQVSAINGRSLPTHQKDGWVEKDLLWTKTVALIRRSLQVVSLIHVNMRWFNMRVDDLLEEESHEVLKNG